MIISNRLQSPTNSDQYVYLGMNSTNVILKKKCLNLHMCKTSGSGVDEQEYVEFLYMAMLQKDWFPP